MLTVVEDIEYLVFCFSVVLRCICCVVSYPYSFFFVHFDDMVSGFLWWTFSRLFCTPSLFSHKIQCNFKQRYQNYFIYTELLFVCCAMAGEVCLYSYRTEQIERTAYVYCPTACCGTHGGFICCVKGSYYKHFNKNQRQYRINDDTRQ